MNILYIMRYWPVYGGGETVTVTLANELVKRGHKVFVAYTMYNTCAPMPYVIDKCIETSKLYTIEGFSKKDVISLREFIRMNHVDLMINQWGNVDLCHQARKGTSCCLVMCWHIAVYHQIYPKKLMGRLLQRVIGANNYQKSQLLKQKKKHLHNINIVDKYVFLSKSFEQEFIDSVKTITEIKSLSKKIGSISNPLPVVPSYDLRNFSEKKRQVLFVGRMYEYQKKLTDLLKIWSYIERDKDLGGWSLVLVGDGPDMESTQQLSFDLSLQRVKFEGFRNPQPYYEESSLFMMTSMFEGFGMTLIEAQQSGVVPVVFDTYRSLHDIVVNRENGMIVPADDIEGFVATMKELMIDDNLRKMIAMNGMESCKKFQVANIVDQWEELFKEISYEE